MSGSRLGTKRRDSLGAGAWSQEKALQQKLRGPLSLSPHSRKTRDSQSPAASHQPERAGLPLN